jgi:hypothetical protein
MRMFIIFFKKGSRTATQNKTACRIHQSWDYMKPSNTRNTINRSPSIDMIARNYAQPLAFIAGFIKYRAEFLAHSLKNFQN